MLVNPVVHQILQQINSMERSAEIKRLLHLKLEAERVDKRFDFVPPEEKQIMDEDGVILLG